VSCSKRITFFPSPVRQVFLQRVPSSVSIVRRLGADVGILDHNNFARKAWESKCITMNIFVFSLDGTFGNFDHLRNDLFIGTNFSPGLPELLQLGLSIPVFRPK
jgi:hypothetical protein